MWRVQNGEGRKIFVQIAYTGVFEETGVMDLRGFVWLFLILGNVWIIAPPAKGQTNRVFSGEVEKG